MKSCFCFRSLCVASVPALQVSLGEVWLRFQGNRAGRDRPDGRSTRRGGICDNKRGERENRTQTLADGLLERGRLFRTGRWDRPVQ